MCPQMLLIGYCSELAGSQNPCHVYTLPWRRISGQRHIINRHLDLARSFHVMRSYRMTSPVFLYFSPASGFGAQPGGAAGFGEVADA